MSKVVRRAECWGDISERQTHCWKPLLSETTVQRGGDRERQHLMNGEMWKTAERGDKTGSLMKGKRRDTNKAANETDASTCCDLFLFI